MANPYSKIKDLITSLEEDFEKSYDKGNAAAGTRVRKGMQDLKNQATAIRKEVQDMKNSSKAAPATPATKAASAAKKVAPAAKKAAPAAKKAAPAAKKK